MIVKDFYKGTAHVRVFDTRDAMGACAGKEAADKIRELQKTKSELNIMFAAAPSQNEILAQLVKEEGIDWSSVNAFHMDEYIGIAPEHPAGFANFLRRAIFSLKPFKSVNCIDCAASSSEIEAARYDTLLREHPIDICLLGVGENGHIAFNDPGVADFNDSKLVKVVDLDKISRQQQANDGCFATLDEVPRQAITVTIPGLVQADYMYCSVPCKTKATAVHRMMTGEIAIDCPATILRQKDFACVYLDTDSASRIIHEVF